MFVRVYVYVYVFRTPFAHTHDSRPLHARLTHIDTHFYTHSYRQEEALELPSNLDYSAIAWLSTEARQRLETTRPRTLGAASRLEGVTAAAVLQLMRHVKRGHYQAARGAAPTG